MSGTNFGPNPNHNPNWLRSDVRDYLRDILDGLLVDDGGVGDLFLCDMIVGREGIHAALVREEVCRVPGSCHQV